MSRTTAIVPNTRTICIILKNGTSPNASWLSSLSQISWEYSCLTALGMHRNRRYGQGLYNWRFI